jgi:hypothetical protein
MCLSLLANAMGWVDSGNWREIIEEAQKHR